MKSNMPVKNQIKETILKNDMLTDVRHVILGFSGGPDSMCLLNALLDLVDGGEYSFDIYPVHINHGIRKDVCDEEQRFCEAYARERGLVCRSFVYDCEAKAKEWGISTEEAGRKLRYDSFGEVARDLGERTVVAVAQNADDQVETVLMRILRGTGVSGLGGIPYIRDDERGYRIIRPLLDVKRKDVLQYCKLRKLSPRMDQTNEEPIYRRNKIRLHLIPYLERNYNPNVKEAILRLAESAREDSGYIDLDSENILKNIKMSEFEETPDYCWEFFVENEALRGLPEAIRIRAIAMILEEAGLSEDVGYDHYKAIDKIIQGDNPSASTDLPRTFYVRREYEKLYIGYVNTAELSLSGEDKSSNTRIELRMKKLRLHDLDRFLTEQDLGPGDYAAYDEEKLIDTYGIGGSGFLEIREKRPGDVMRLNVGTKKVQDILVDAKIPMKERDLATVVAIGNDVLWLLPYGGMNRRWSSEFRIDQETQLVVVFYIPHE